MQIKSRTFRNIFFVRFVLIVQKKPPVVEPEPCWFIVRMIRKAVLSSKFFYDRCDMR